MHAEKANRLAIIGGGPAGLMAAETCLDAGVEIHIYDAMPSFGRKFLLAGRGGLNLTHSESFDTFLTRFGTAGAHLKPYLEQFTPQNVRAWATSLGSDTFIGSSGRVFPKELKASPLLRRWLQRLEAKGVIFHRRHRWTGWRDATLLFETPSGPVDITPDATILALGGASWPKLGSDAAWLPLLRAKGVEIHEFAPANCGFDLDWSDFFANRFAGIPVKPVSLAFGNTQARGEFVITRSGIEGSLIYALSAQLRDAITQSGKASVTLDLAPDHKETDLLSKLAKLRGTLSLATKLARLGLRDVKTGLLRESFSTADLSDPHKLVKAIKATPLTLLRPRPVAEAISSAGGVSFAALDEHLMLNAIPGTFCAGEMLDWEAPTGGYLLTACLATGRAAGLGAKQWLTR